MNKNYFIAVPALILVSACTDLNASRDNSAEPQSYPVISVIEKDTALHAQYVADIQARKNVEIYARVPGILEHIHVDEGETVRKGQLLFTINDDELQIALSKANAAWNNAKADAHVAEVELQRVQTLVHKKIISKTEQELAEAKLNALKAKIEEALSEKQTVLKRLSYTRIHSPFDGVIDRLPLKEGSFLPENTQLTTISDIHSMLAYFKVSESEYLKLMQEGRDSTMAASVSLVLADGSLYPYPGKIETYGSEIDDNTGSVTFRADFPNPRKMLKHGASGTLIIGRPNARVLMVPQKSVLEIQDKNYVYVLGADNTVQMKNFEPSSRINGYYIVESGLTAKDKILYEGVQSIRSGQKISPVAPRL
ncbi:efflux RND transporter periplasmic adaptor subunit [Taibaiella chishuiensis]|uniref:Membrane fusion protein (Multidrug efflux system) n=1 Tax=Taibaiella chishuiensis TaxID=1434707 RepID=A0A2P8D7T7_9BACT|nr:efflux RND transporter periplasmic adaptor subunit [Taibaiella chishuiensis]PSK93241.1 membrane fusion protein (multidrug efflux system) [Taibaiella chishuiensis]